MSGLSFYKSSKVRDDLVCASASALLRSISLSTDAFVLKTTVAPSGSFEEDVSTLPKDAKTCATYVYRTDEKKGSNGWHWVLITFVPDHAGVSIAFMSCFVRDLPYSQLSLFFQVRSKMLHASSKGGLLKALGEGRFKQNMFFTSQVSSRLRRYNSGRPH